MDKDEKQEIKIIVLETKVRCLQEDIDLIKKKLIKSL